MAIQRGMRADEILGSDIGDRMSPLAERTVLAMYHLQQGRAWTENIIEGIEAQLAAAGVHSRLAHRPAMCFLDVSGYPASPRSVATRGRFSLPRRSAESSARPRSTTAAGRSSGSATA